MSTPVKKSIHEASELPEEIEDFKDWLSAQEGEPYSEDDIEDWGWDYADDRVEYPNGVKTHYTTYTTKYGGSKYTCEVAWDNFNEVVQGCEVWKGGPEAKKSEAVSTDTARQYVKDHVDSILDTLAEICAQTADAAIEDVNGKPDPDEVIKDDAHAAFKDYGQTLKELAINMAVKFAKTQLPESKQSESKKESEEWFGKEDILKALGNALHNEDEAYVIRFFEGTPGYAYAYNKNGHDAWRVSSDGTVEFEFDGESRGKKKITSLDDLKSVMLRLFGLQG